MYVPGLFVLNSLVQHGPQSGIDVFAFSVLGDTKGDGCLSVLTCVVAEYDESVAQGFKVFYGLVMFFNDTNMTLFKGTLNGGAVCKGAGKSSRR